MNVRNKPCHPERAKRVEGPAVPTISRRGSILPCLLILLALAVSNPTQAQVLDNFTWLDLKTDTQTLPKVTQFLRDKPYTAIREIGLAGQQALVITTLRKDPIAQPGNDTFTAYGISLRDGSVEELLDGTNLKYIDWQKFYDDDTPELLATYDDCAQCKATTFLTAFYIDRKSKRWGARWRREIAGAPLYSADATSEHIYALFINVDQRVVLDTWASTRGDTPQQKKSTRPAEYLFEYRIDPMSDQGTSRPITGRDMQPIKDRLCKAQDVVFGIAGGQDREACRALAGALKKPR